MALFGGAVLLSAVIGCSSTKKDGLIRWSEPDPKEQRKQSLENLNLAISNGDIARVNVLLLAHIEDVNMRGEKGITPLMVASINKNSDIIKLLLAKGADVNIKDSSGLTALNYIIENEPEANAIELSGNAAIRQMSLNLETVKKAEESFRLLIESGADVNALDKRVALFFALKTGFDSCVKSLIDNNADVNTIYDDGSTPLMIAIDSENLALVKFLLEHGADANIREIDGKTSLMTALANDNLDVARVLVQGGADVSAQADDGTTALMGSAFFGKFEYVKLLVESGVDVNAKTPDGNTALSLAQKQNHTKIADFLKQHGAKE